MDVERKVVRTEEEWRRLLTPEQFRILRLRETERAETGDHAHEDAPGVYRCAGCGTELFRSEAKYESGSGWPSFTEPVSPENVETEVDRSHFMERVEVLCAVCEGHLGHVFPDGPGPAGLRYCINSAALKLDETDDA